MIEEKRDWEKIVEDNKDAMFHLPEALQEEAAAGRALFKRRTTAWKENEISMVFNERMFKIRKDLEEKGREDIWTHDIGFNTAALDDGKFIINIDQKNR